MRRQVNERWLDQFRNGVYGAGFGWQIGVGITTYIMTTAVFLTIGLGALSGRPIVALLIGSLFGLARGLAVLVGANITSAEGLRLLHRRLDRMAEPVRWTVVAVQAVAAILLAYLWWWPASVLLAGLVPVAFLGMGARHLFVSGASRPTARTRMPRSGEVV